MQRGRAGAGLPAAGLAAAIGLALAARAGVAVAATGGDAPEAITPASAETSDEPADRGQRLADLVHRGNEARQKGRVAAALQAYREARDLAPERYEVRILLADTLRRSGRTDEARVEYIAAAGIDPSRPEAQAGQALLLRAAYDLEGAAALVEAALPRLVPASRPELLLTLAETRRRQGRLEEAARLFTEVMRARPGDLPARVGQTRVAEERGDLEAALAGWEDYLKLKPEDEGARLHLQDLREIKASIAALGSAAARTSDAAVETELGRLLAVAGDARSAAQAYRRALALDPERLEARRGLALALRDAGESRGAVTQFRRVLKQRPDDASSLYNLAALARASGDRDREEAAWIDLVAARPDDLFAARGFVAFLESGDPQALGRAIDRLRAAGPAESAAGASPGRRRLEVLLLAAAQRWSEAAEVLYRTLRLDATDPWTLAVANDVLSIHPDLLRAMGEKALAEAGGPGGEARVSDASLLVLLSRFTWWAGRSQEALLMA
ncbi:MAG TPA: tetratricopeptide repeat protein, partial [Candidatus Polarisedimenticolia bacterium]|nr:tetratricopeptide repeat protein [Candidatus Polarisedimenticolia bacterium]